MAYRYPDSHVFYRTLGREYPRIVRGEGCWLVDERGKRYLDAVGGAFVANLGHSNPAIAEALGQQARRFGYLSGTAFTHEPIEALAAELAATLPGDLDKLYFLSSGSEAVEAALKLARQYWVERGSPGSTRSSRSPPPITATRCSPCRRRHGSTTARSTASGWWTCGGFRRRIPTGVRAAATRPVARSAAARRSRRRSPESAPSTWRRSSPSRWAARRRERPRRGRTTSSGFARSEIATR